jgi:hypothetical protein
MNLFQTKPDRLHLRFAVALAAKESVEANDQTRHFVELELGRLVFV